MAAPKKTRQLAFQVLYQIDLTDGHDPEAAIGSIDEADDLSEKEIKKAVTLAKAAFDARDISDARMKELAPDWPAHRQAAVDRAILRLAHYEMTATQTPPKVVVNEAVELAKRYSTKKSPSFINALLDKVLKDVLANAAPVHAGEDQAPAATER